MGAPSFGQMQPCTRCMAQRTEHSQVSVAPWPLSLSPTPHYVLVQVPLQGTTDTMRYSSPGPHYVGPPKILLILIISSLRYHLYKESWPSWLFLETIDPSLPFLRYRVQAEKQLRHFRSSPEDPHPHPQIWRHSEGWWASGRLQNTSQKNKSIMNSTFRVSNG